MKPEIERRSNLSYEEFAAEYLFSNRPVVITDALRQWKALKRWSPEFFRKEFGDMKFTINEDRNQNASYAANSTGTEYTISRFIARVLESTETNPAPYFRNRVLYDTFPSLKSDIDPIPDYSFPNWLTESFLLKKAQRLFHRGAQIEIYIGGKGSGFPVLHYDGLGSHAFLMQIYGQKKFILYGPDQDQFLYAEPSAPNLSRVRDVEHADLETFPLFAKAEPSVFILQPGELLFVPSKWWHTTKMLTPSISISVNVVNSSNWDALTQDVAGRLNPLMQIPGRIYLKLAGAWRSRRDRRARRRASSDGKQAVSISQV